LTGHDQPEHVFALKQALALYDAYTEQVRECDAEIERRFQAITPVGPDELPPLNRANKHRTHNKNASLYDTRGMLYQRDSNFSGSEPIGTPDSGKGAQHECHRDK
jgi:transposase